MRVARPVRRRLVGVNPCNHRDQYRRFIRYNDVSKVFHVVQRAGAMGVSTYENGRRGQTWPYGQAFTNEVVQIHPWGPERKADTPQLVQPRPAWGVCTAVTRTPGGADTPRRSSEGSTAKSSTMQRPERACGSDVLETVPNCERLSVDG